MATISAYQTAQGKRYRVRYRTPDHRQTDKRGFRTKRDAELFAASVEVSKARGEFVSVTAGRITIAELAPTWLAIKRSKLKPSSYRPVEIAWRVYVNPRWGKTPVSDVRLSHVETWISELCDGTAETDRTAKRRVKANEATPKSATTVLRAYGVLAGILDTAVKDERLNANPARGVDNLPQKRRKPRVYLTHDQVWALADAAKGRAPIILTLAYCGLRWGELAGLRVGDVMLDKRRLIVEENAVRVGAEIIVGSTKGEEAREVPFPAFLAEHLRKAVGDRSPLELLFPNALGGHMVRPGTGEQDDSWFTRALAGAGIRRMTIHDLRHTAASLAISAGANVKAVQRMLGHASAAMTLDVYADLFDDDLDTVAVALNHAAIPASVGKVWANLAPEGRGSA